MLYPFTHWLDEVDQYENRYREVNNPDGTITHTKERGTVQQVGTNQDAEHFNNMEAGILDANLAVSILAIAMRQHQVMLETGVVTLKGSTDGYPFPGDAVSVKLTNISDTKDYAVTTEVVSATGPVEDVVVTDKLANGFKLTLNGSAPTASVRYTVIGGYLK